jgi:hypothetical protein
VVHLRSGITNDFDIFGEKLVAVLRVIRSVVGFPAPIKGITYKTKEGWELCRQVLVYSHCGHIEDYELSSFWQDHQMLQEQQSRYRS